MAAVNVLTTVANLFPMSMLACFGNDAEAVREIFINRYVIRCLLSGKSSFFAQYFSYTERNVLF